MSNAKRIGFIGYGNMAQAMARGFVRHAGVDASSISACARDWDRLVRNTGELGVRSCANAHEVVEASDVVIIAVKPYLVADVVKPITQQLAGKTVLSVAAGVNFEQLEDMLAPGTHHLSLIPNIPVSVGQGVCVLEQRHSLDDAELSYVLDLLDGVGITQFVDTHLMGTAMVVASCGPAFAAMFIEALGDAGVKHGLPRQLAYRLGAQMIAGTGAMYVETERHPAALKDDVCSPGGSTIRGVAALERGGMRASVIDAVDAVLG